MPFLPPNQQRQSTEGKIKALKAKAWFVEKSIVSFISKITVCWHFTAAVFKSPVWLTNDSSLARSAAEHAPDHDGEQ